MYSAQPWLRLLRTLDERVTLDDGWMMGEDEGLVGGFLFAARTPYCGSSTKKQNKLEEPRMNGCGDLSPVPVLRENVSPQRDVW